MLIHNNRRTCYANSFVILYYHIKTCYANAHIIVITHTSYAISYIKVLNDLCIYTKRLYTFPQLYNATSYYISNADGKRGLTFYLLVKSNKV